jgi:hypothetical protein
MIARDFLPVHPYKPKKTAEITELISLHLAVCFVVAATWPKVFVLFFNLPSRPSDSVWLSAQTAHLSPLYFFD